MAALVRDGPCPGEERRTRVDLEAAQARLRATNPQTALFLRSAGLQAQPGEKMTARYPGTERERRIEPELLQRWVVGIFIGCGMSDADASLLADSLVQGDLRGIHSHGGLRVPDHVAKLTREGANPRGKPRVVSQTGGAISTAM